ncbi:MAG: HAD family phosphatase [Deltaproteobacteria bacterium]|nr:HAD family phosphatase [Deltaproteobacteria bacterium]
MTIRAIFWDNDGVLVDTEKLYFQSTREILRQIGIPFSEALFRQISLAEGRSSFELAAERGYSSEAIERLVEARNRRYTELLQAGVSIIDGVEETLAALKGRVTMGIVTSCRRGHFEAIHQGTGTLLSHFAFILAREDYGLSKPDPEPYRTALGKVGLPAEACLVVEDSPRGLKSAVAAGIRCVVIPNALTAGSDFSAAWRVLASCREIPELIGQANG